MKKTFCATFAATLSLAYAQEFAPPHSKTSMFSREAAGRMARKACLDMAPVAALGLETALLKDLPYEKVRAIVAKRTESDRIAGKLYASVLDNEEFTENTVAVVIEHARLVREKYPNDRSKYAESVKATHSTYVPACEKDLKKIFLSYFRTR